MPICSYRPTAQLRQALLDGAELALIDVREEADFARSHPLFAANLPLSKLELDIFRRVPRLTTPITVYDGGEGLAERAVERLQSWGYQDVALLEGGLSGWQRSGGELALRIEGLIPSPQATVIVNCAGRTRSIIGTQSLRNAGLPNPVYALRNGTIGWTLAGLDLERGQQRRYDADFRASVERATAVRQLAERAGVAFIDTATLQRWLRQPARTTYLFDVRSPEEYAAGHLPLSVSAPGGQLVQETDHFASVRGARIVLIADDAIRAPITASWLAQMGWEVAVLNDARPEDFSERGTPAAKVPPGPQAEEISPRQLAEQLRVPGTVVLDFTTSANYVARHIPGAYWLVRSQLRQALEVIPQGERYVVTCGSSLLARYAVPEVAALTGKQVQLLSGGTLAWIDAGLALEHGETHLATPRSDRYQRPYEGTDNSPAAMQAYLDWEFGLVEQLARDGTHGFKVL